MSKKCAPLWCEAYFQVNMLKAPGARTTFEGSVLPGRCKGFCTLPRVSKTWGFRNISKNDGSRGAFEEDLERWISRGRCSTKDMFIRDVGRSGRWFPEKGCILEHQTVRFAKMILRDRCSTSYDLASAQYFRQMEWKNRETHWHEAISSALNFPLSKEVSQNCFVFDVANFKNWGILAELLCFWRYQVQKLGKSRRIASFLTLSSSKTEEVSQKSFVFKLADKQIDSR